MAGNLLLEAVGTDIKSILNTGYFKDNPIYLQFSTRPSANIELVFSGLAKFNSGDITAPSSGSANWNVTFKGTGQLTMIAQEYSLLIDAMPPEAQWPILVDQDVI